MKQEKVINRKRGKKMNAVLSLDDFKCAPTTKSINQNNLELKKFWEENVADIVDLEINRSGIDEFEEAMMKGKKNERK